MLPTNYLLPTSVISTGDTTGNAWSNTAAILLVDGQTADSNPSPGLSSDIIVGNFNFNIPVGATIQGIQFEVIGYRGPQTVPDIALTIYAVDDSSTVAQYYPFTAPFTGLTTSSATYTFGSSSYLFATTWTVNQINNFKLQLIANGEVHIDAVLVKVYYTPSAGPTPEPAASGICEEELQTQPFQLAIPLASTDTSMILSSFNYSDGSAIAFADFGAAGFCDMVIDKGIAMYEENVRVTSITTLANGNVQLGFTSLSNRGLMFHEPYTTDANLRKGHNTGAEVIISNNAPFYQRFLKKCHIDVLVSAPIEVEDEGIEITPHVHKFNFVGPGVTVQDAGDDGVNVVIPGAGGVTPPTVVGVGSGTSGNVQVGSLSYTLEVSGVNRGAIIQISTENARTVTSVTVGGVAATQESVRTDVVNNLRSEIWVCIAPPVGTQNVIVTLSGTAYISSGAEAIVAMNQTTPVGDTSDSAGSSTTPSVTVNTTVDNSLVFDGLSTGITPIAYVVGPGQVLEWSKTANTDTRQGASSLQPAGTTPEAVVMSYVITQNTPWVMTAVEIIGIQTSSDQYVRADAADTTSGYLDDKIEIVAGTNVTVIKTIQNIGGDEKISYEISSTGGGSGSGGGFQVDQTPDNGTYGLLAGSVNGSNTDFTVSAGVYVSGKLFVFLNGLAQMQGASDDFVELVPGSGTFRFNVAPLTGDIITAVYADSSVLPSALEVEENGATIETGVTKINFKNGPNVTNPAPDEVDVDFAGLFGGGNTVQALAGNTFTGATLPQPVSFGDGATYRFFGFNNTPPTFSTQNVGNNITTEKRCYTFEVREGNIVLIDNVNIWVDQVIGSPTDYRLSIQETTAGNPNGTIIGASSSFVPVNSPSYQGANLSSTIQLSAPQGGGDVTFAIVIDRTGAVDGANYIVVGAENAGGVNVAPYTYNTGSWTTSNLQPAMNLRMTYVTNTAYISAQTGAGNPRMQSIIVNSGGGNPYTDTVPTVLQTSLGWTENNVAIGASTPITISGSVSGFSGLTPTSKYYCNRSDGNIAASGSTTIVGRAILTDTILIDRT